MNSLILMFRGSEAYYYNGFASGMNGLSAMSNYMNTGGSKEFATMKDFDDSNCFWCKSIWSSPEDPNTDIIDNGVLKEPPTGSSRAYRNYLESASQDSYIVGAYASEWSVYRGNFAFKDIPFEKGLSYLLYAFIPVCGDGIDGAGQLALCTVWSCKDAGEGSSNGYFALNQACKDQPAGSVSIHDPWSAFWHGGLAGPEFGMGTFQYMMMAKNYYKDQIKIMPSVGGWSLSKVFTDFANEDMRSVFVDSMESFLLTWPFWDGVDIDWEFPGGGGAEKDGSTEKIEFLAAAVNQTEVGPIGSENCSPLDTLYGEFSSWNTLSFCKKLDKDDVIERWLPPVGCSKLDERQAEFHGMFEGWSDCTEYEPHFEGCTQCDGYTVELLFTDLRGMLDRLQGKQGNFIRKDGERYELTTAISGNPDVINEVDYGKLIHDEVLDHIFLMSYDFMGAWGAIGHQTNLYPSETGTDFSTHEAVQHLLNQGVPPEKIIMGVAAYGRGWKHSGIEKGMGLESLFNVTGQLEGCDGTVQAGVQDWFAIEEEVERGIAETVWDGCAMADMVIKDGQAYTADTTNSIFAKGYYVIENKLGGLFTWELVSDDKKGTIINSMHESLGRTAALGSGGSESLEPTLDYKKSSCAIEPLEAVLYSNRKWESGIGPNCGRKGKVKSSYNDIWEKGCGIVDLILDISVINCHYEEGPSSFQVDQTWLTFCQEQFFQGFDDQEGVMPETCKEAKENMISQFECDCGMHD